MRRSTVLSHPFQLVFHVPTIKYRSDEQGSSMVGAAGTKGEINEMNKMSFSRVRDETEKGTGL